ncbi:MAG TPA: tudor domain-containing protein [Longimicrobiales bacterium]
MTHADDEMRQVLQRAAQLEQAASLDAEEIETLLQAADEVGIPRAAVERALRERSTTLPVAPVAGSLVFAPSADRMYYVAEVLEVLPAGFRVRFLRGGEHVVQLEDLRPCSFLPGQRVQAKWPGWGNWTCTVVGYDAAEQALTLSDGWSEARKFNIADVWLSPAKPQVGPNRARLRAALLGAAAAGAAIGSIITALLLG